MTTLLILLAIGTGIWGNQILKDDKHISNIEYATTSPAMENELISENETITFRPVSSTYATFALTKDIYTLSIGILSPPDEEERMKNGKSSSTDIQLSAIINGSFVELFYQKYKGFQIVDTAGRSDQNITSLNYGAAVTYFFDKTYDPLTTYSHINHKREYQGSQIITFNIAHSEFKSSNNLIPAELASDFENFDGLNEIRTNQLSVGYGGSGQYTYKKFYFQGQLSYGLNLSQIKFKNSKVKNGDITGSTLTFKADVGYQFEKSLLGFNTIRNTYRTTSGEDTFAQSRVSSSLYYKHYF